MELETTRNFHDDPLAPTSYFDQTTFGELRRYVSLDMARLVGADPQNATIIAREFERYLIGHGPRPQVKHD